MTNIGCIMMCVGVVASIAGSAGIGTFCLVGGFFVAVAGRMREKA